MRRLVALVAFAATVLGIGWPTARPEPLRIQAVAVPAGSRILLEVDPSPMPKLRPAKVHVNRVQASPIAPAPPAGPSGPSGPVDWDAIADCESSGEWDINNGNGFWGGLQFWPSTWFAYGGGPFEDHQPGAGPPFPYSREAQIAVAERVLAAQGIGAWPYCGRFG